MYGIKYSKEKYHKILLFMDFIDKSNYEFDYDHPYKKWTSILEKYDITSGCHTCKKQWKKLEKLYRKINSFNTKWIIKKLSSFKKFEYFPDFWEYEVDYFDRYRNREKPEPKPKNSEWFNRIIENLKLKESI